MIDTPRRDKLAIGILQMPIGDRTPVLLESYANLEREFVAANERAEANEKQLRAAKYIVWCAQWSFRKLQSVRNIMPHAECDHYVSMQPQVEKWLAGNDQVGVDFTEGHADLMAALAAIDAARSEEGK